VRYVLDASVALCWVIPRPLTPVALRLLDEYQKRIHELIAPSHFPGEIANGLTKAGKRWGQGNDGGNDGDRSN
jgi:predicted nucleic acid-binding protein